VRIFNTSGPRVRPHAGRAIPTFMRQALQDRPITVFGDGSQTRSFCYVSDLVDGIIRLADSGFHHPVNVGNPNEFTLLELARTVIDVCGSRSEIVHEALPEDDPQVRQPDITLAREILEHTGRAIPTFMRQALTGKPITVFGDGSQTRSFTYVDDLIAGMIALQESGYHDPVNVGNPNEFTLLELAEAVVEITGSSSEIVYEALPTDDPKIRQPNIDLAKQVLSWEPTVQLRDGLQRTLDQSGVDVLVGAAR